MVFLFDNDQILKAYIKEKIEEDWKEGWREGWKEGWEEGRVEGETLKALEVAKKMLQESFPQDVVTRISGLPLSEVNALKAQMAP